jgi:hypothetical protein
MKCEFDAVFEVLFTTINAGLVLVSIPLGTLDRPYRVHSCPCSQTDVVFTYGSVGNTHHILCIMLIHYNVHLYDHSLWH